MVNTTPQLLYPWDRTPTHCTGGWVSPRDSLDRCKNLAPHRDSIPGPSSPQQVAILTELSQPTLRPLIYIQYFPSHPIFKHPRFISFLHGADQLSCPYKTTATITVSYISVFKERQNVLKSYHKFNLLSFLDAVAQLQKVTSFIMSACLSDHMEQLGSHQMDFHKT